MARFSRQSQDLAWVTVAAVIVGALVIAGSVIAGSLPAAIVGIAVVIMTLVVYTVLSRHNAVAPVSFDEEFPPDTPDPRKTDDGRSGPPISTDSARMKP